MSSADQNSILDNPVWSSLTGSHARFAEGRGLARRYPADISPFYAISDFADPMAWADLEELVGPGGRALLAGNGLAIPAAWSNLGGGSGLQMTGDNVMGEFDAEAVELSEVDSAQILDLVVRTQPGPFARRTVELGGYIGFRIDGKLAAMAGCRLNPTGWREISAVCTDADYRGKGLGGRLVMAVAFAIRTKGEIPFLHVSQTNHNAIRLYETLGFQKRMVSSFAEVQAP